MQSGAPTFLRRVADSFIPAAITMIINDFQSLAR